MNTLEKDPFVSLFLAACRKCFNTGLTGPLSEAESRHLSNEILEKTGLVIGAKSIKNYSFYAAGHSPDKPENPSTATLDTLARYVLNGPYTDETARKKNEGHYPYWFRYKSSLADEQLLKEPAQAAMNNPRSRQNPAASRRSLLLIFVLGFVAASVGLWYLASRKPDTSFALADSFDNISADSLAARGWMLHDNDALYWNRRAEKPGALTFFTLPGDNWADSSGRQGIRNLLVRPLAAGCFSTEIHLEGFFPTHNWQQAGILLMDEGPGKGRSLRVSLAYNSYFGGYARAPEIYLQAIMSRADDPGKPEEIIHLPLFTLAPGQEDLVKKNMEHAAIRIEKTGDRFRILYAAGPVANFAFKEAGMKEMAFQPTYLGLFALEGFVPDTDYMPVAFSWFGLKSEPCK